jgi:transposase
MVHWIRVLNVRTARGLHTLLQKEHVDVGYRTVLRKLHQIEFLKLRRPRCCPYLTNEHKKKRLEWAREMLASDVDWAHVYFADEKEWHLDGPAFRSKLWQDIRDPPLVVQRKGGRNTSLMVWGVFSWNRVPALVIIPKRINSEQYCDIIRKRLQRYAKEEGMQLCHDRLPAHQSVATNEWLHQHGIKVLLLPPKAADINPIENLWGIVSRKVFAQARTYDDEESLTTAIKEAWASIQKKQTVRQHLVDSLPGRLEEVVRLKGGWIEK